MAKMPKVKIRSAELPRKQRVERRISRPPKKAVSKRKIGERIKRYLREVRQELKKVVWPSRQQVLTSSIVVIVVLIIFSLFIGALDFIWVKVIKFISLRF